MKDLLCMLDPFFSQSVQVDCLAKILLDVFFKFIGGKVRLMVWPQEGISTTAIVGPLGRQCTSIYSLLAETKGLPYFPFLGKKRSCSLAPIKRHALKGQNTIWVKNTFLYRTIKQ
jgi:hypothetical protein